MSEAESGLESEFISRRGRRGLVLISVALVVLATVSFLYLRPALTAARRPVTAPPLPVGGAVQSFTFFDQSAGWAVLVSPAGRLASTTPMSIVRTSDGGRHWKRADVPGVQTYALTRFFDPTHGIVSVSTQSRHILYSTADGGQRWRSFPLPGHGSAADALSLVFLDPRRGWYLEQVSPLLPNLGLGGGQVPQQALWRTVDGGATWDRLLGLDATHQPSAGGLTFGGFKALSSFSDEQHGCLVSVADETQPPTFYLTADGGQTWRPLAVPAPAYALVGGAWGGGSYRLFRLHDLLVELVGPEVPYTSYFTQTSADGGLSWTALRPLPIQAPRLVLPQFQDSRHWYLAAGRFLWRTADAGQTWQSQPAAIPGSLSMSDLQVVDHRVMWVIALRDDAPDAPDHLLRSIDGGTHWEDQGPPFLQLAS